MNTDSVHCNEQILALRREAERLEEDAIYSSMVDALDAGATGSVASAADSAV